jgi:pyridoxal phosphate enzyme (YggS family)
MNAALVERWQRVIALIRESEARHGRTPGSVSLLAVSKKHSLDAIEELYRAGQRDFGENYVQELVGKAQGARERGLDEIHWHLIGHLQSNKIKALLPWVHKIHTVDSASLASQLARRWRESGRGGRLPVLIELNLSAESSKSGLSESLLGDLVREIEERADALELRGLMCIPENDQAATLRSFTKLKSLGRELQDHTGATELSMGMTSDYDLAISQGSTCVRVGTAIFGERPTSESPPI